MLHIVNELAVGVPG